MRILLDTHIFLWCVKNDSRLSKKMQTVILEADEVYISSVSIWEACIKKSLGKLDVNIYELVDAVSESGFKELPLSFHHSIAISELPHHHRDPFDRILIAQALCEPLILLTADKILQQYSGLIELIS